MYLMSNLKKFKTETEISEKFEELNTLAKNMKEINCQGTISQYISYTYTMSTLMWVMGEIPKLPLENLMKCDLEAKLKERKQFERKRKK
jgi:hypothetical protein